LSAPLDDNVESMGTTPIADMGEAGALRLDKWLWHARFFKSRSLATKLCAAGKVRINRVTTTKAHQLVRPGDVLTFPQGWQIRVVKVLGLGLRRGPAVEAQKLYQDLAPNVRPSGDGSTEPGPAVRAPGSGRPTKKERRAIDRLGEES